MREQIRSQTITCIHRYMHTSVQRVTLYSFVCLTFKQIEPYCIILCLAFLLNISRLSFMHVCMPLCENSIIYLLMFSVERHLGSFQSSFTIINNAGKHIFRKIAYFPKNMLIFKLFPSKMSQGLHSSKEEWQNISQFIIK